MKRYVAILALMAGALAVSNQAQAQSVLHTPMPHDHLEIEVHALLPYYYGFGVGGGARVGIPLLAEGFGHSLNNSLNLSVGADIFYDFYGGGETFIGIPIHVDAQWNLYLTEKLSVFAEVGVDPELHFWSGCGSCSVFYFWFDAAIGARYHLNAPNGFPAIIARVGSSGITVGISF